MSDPVQVEGLVLPDLKFTQADWDYAAAADKQAQGVSTLKKESSIKAMLHATHAAVSCRERQLADTIAQRDAARNYVTRICTGHMVEDHWVLKQRAEKAEVALAEAREESDCLEGQRDIETKRADTAEEALAAEKALSKSLRDSLVKMRTDYPEPDYDTTCAERSINL